MFRYRFAFALMLLTPLCVSAQPGPGPHRMGPGPGAPGDFAFLGGEFGFGKVVTGAPYSAQITTQFTQTLADGTHIQRSTSATVSRDSQGRSRREETMAAMGRLAASGATSRTTVFIHDPVASMSYVLDPNARTYHQMQLSGRGGHFEPRGQGPGAPHSRPNMAATTVDLGTQVIAGVNAQGKRVTRAIAAGAEGNDKEIDIVTETWTAPDLQIVVMSKTSDPRFGERVYQLTNITRAEPDPSLFVVPAGYAMQQGRRPHGPPPQ